MKIPTPPIKTFRMESAHLLEETLKSQNGKIEALRDEMKTLVAQAKWTKKVTYTVDTFVKAPEDKLRDEIERVKKECESQIKQVSYPLMFPSKRVQQCFA